MPNANTLQAAPLPALPPQGAVYTPPTVIGEVELRDHYTRLQIHQKHRGHSKPSRHCIVGKKSVDDDDHRKEAHDEDDEDDEELLKLVALSGFLALSLVRKRQHDVVAVSIDRSPQNVITIAVAKNETDQNADVEQANKLKLLFDRIACRENPAEKPDYMCFRREYISIIYGWGKDKIDHRFTSLVAGKDIGRKSYLGLDKALRIIQEIKAESQLRRIANETVSKISLQDESSGSSSLLQGDRKLLRQARARNCDLVDIVSVWIEFVRNSFTRYRKGTRGKGWVPDVESGNENGALDTNALVRAMSIADLLGASNIVKLLLGMTDLSVPVSRRQFIRALIKLGQYAQGTRALFDAITKCEEGKQIKSIQYRLVPCTIRPDVQCRENWYDHVLSEADRIVLWKELNATQAMMESGSGLVDYIQKCPAFLHAEVVLCLWRREQGLISGEIGVSKRCCVTCQETLSAMTKSMGCSYKVAEGHGKHYMTQITGIKVIDLAVIRRVKKDFEDWVERMVISGDSDPSSSRMGSDVPHEEVNDLVESLFGKLA